MLRHSIAKAHCYHALDFAGISVGNANASIRLSSRCECRRDEIIVKGLIKRNKEIKRRRYPRRDTQSTYKERWIAAAIAGITRAISRFLVAIPPGENRKLERTALFRWRGQAFALERRINRDTRQARERPAQWGGKEKDG